MCSNKISILHFNDVYKVGPQKIDTKSSETIDVCQFAQQLLDLRSEWGPDDAGLTLFSGDLFSPSVESTVTRGSHLVPVINLLNPDVALTGNHDFDFGYPHLTKLIKDTKFPWLLSNIIDSETSTVPEGLKEFVVIEKGGMRIGVIGLVEKDWIATVSSWPPNFKWKDMTETGVDLSKRLRDPNGEHKVDIIIALTHSRLPTDIALAKTLFALTPSEQEKKPIVDLHGVDVLLGGHDHLYFAPSGVTSWDGYDIKQPSLGAEEDKGDVLIVKSGMDFRDLSAITIELEDTAVGSARKKVIKTISGKRHTTKPELKSSEELKKILENVLKSVGSTLKAPVCHTTTTLDLRSQFIRTQESAAANWFADVLTHSYDDALCVKSGGGADAVFICAGTLRGDSQYGPGDITMGDILEILPFEDPIVVLELDGAAIWDALEASLQPWPAQEGRFPVISGLRVSWDSRKDPGKRVLGVWLQKEVTDDGVPATPGGATPVRRIDAEVIKREKGGRLYKVVTREYLAAGHDGFDAFKGHRYLIDDEGGALMSTLVRQYLMGSHFVNKMSKLVSHPSQEDLHENTKRCIVRKQKEEAGKSSSSVASKWRKAITQVIHHRLHYQDHARVSYTEHMSGVDPFNGDSARKGEPHTEPDAPFANDDLLVISPEVDGRLKDEGRA